MSISQASEGTWSNFSRGKALSQHFILIKVTMLEHHVQLSFLIMKQKNMFTILDLYKISDSYRSKQTKDEIILQDHGQNHTSNLSISQVSARTQPDVTRGKTLQSYK